MSQQQQHRGGGGSAESVPGPTHTHADTALKHNGGIFVMMHA